MLAAYGIMVEGKKVLLHLALGERESYDAWLSFCRRCVNAACRSRCWC